MKNLRNIIITCIVLFAAALLSCDDVGPADAATVTRVVDGDTIVVRNTEEYRVRLIGVDTPETVHPNGIVEPWGKEASDFTKKELTGKQVYLEYDEEPKDRYGRRLAYVWTEPPEGSEKKKEDILFNCRLVREGYARERFYPPNKRHQALLQSAEERAMEENKGLWHIEGEEGPAKGNRRSKLYHMPGDPQYDSISEKNVIYFDTAKDAEKAGYQRAFRR